MGESARARSPDSGEGNKPMRQNDHPTPLHLLVITALAVFIGEVVVMFFLTYLPTLSVPVEALVDGLCLTVLAAPVLYLSLFRPMVGHIRERRRAEEALLGANKELERRVEKRTAELVSAVKSLQSEVEKHKRTEEELTRTNRFVRAVVESVPFVLLIYEVDSNRCVFANSRLEESLGYTPEDACVQGKSFFETILEPEGYAAFRESNRKLMQGEPSGVRKQELALRHASGDLRRFEVMKTVLSRTESGEPREVLLVARKSAEEAA